MSERTRANLLAVEYVTGIDERVVSEGELALIYSVLPDLLSGAITNSFENEE